MYEVENKFAIPVNMIYFLSKQNINMIIEVHIQYKTFIYKRTGELWFVDCKLQKKEFFEISITRNVKMTN